MCICIYIYIYVYIYYIGSPWPGKSGQRNVLFLKPLHFLFELEPPRQKFPRFQFLGLQVRVARAGAGAGKAPLVLLNPVC